MMVRHRRLHFTTFDLLASLPLIALGLLVIPPLLHQILTPRVEARLLLRGTPPVNQSVRDITTFVGATRSSPSLAAAIRDDLLRSNLPAPRSVHGLQQELSKSFRIGVIPGTYLIDISMRVHDPERDTAILNATVKTFLKTQGPGRYKLIELARPPRRPTTLYPPFRILADLATILVLNLVSLLVVSRFRGIFFARRTDAIPSAT